MSCELTVQDYLNEIETWKKASALHAKKAIEQYKKVVENVEKFSYEKHINETILNNLQEIVIVYNNKDEIVVFNKSACRFFDIDSEKIIGMQIDALPIELHRFIKSYLHIDIVDDIVYIAQKYFKFNHDILHIEDETFYIISLSEITHIVELQNLLQEERNLLEKRVHERTKELLEEIDKRKKIQEELESMVYIDFLTKLPNRKSFIKRLKLLLQTGQTKDDHYLFSMFFIDLDGFKSINDTLGHNIGDELLVKVANIIKSSVRNNDFVARLAGDEFVALIDNVREKKDIETIARQILEAIKQPIFVGRGQQVFISCSIGILMHPPKGLDHFTMLSLADKAMYKVKESGKQSYCFFDEKMSEEFYKKTEIMNKINNALHTDEFFLEYQPICDGAGNILSCEVLSRWKNNGKYISPIYFIPILEEKGLIGEFTYKVIENVYRDLSTDLPISCASVNLSIFQFYDEDLVSFLEKKAKEFPNVAPRISFEITENVFSRDPDIVRKKLTSIKALGHKIYLDDFGTGYSSFGYIVHREQLSKLPFQGI